jgi:hypothetical protein
MENKEGRKGEGKKREEKLAAPYSQLMKEDRIHTYVRISRASTGTCRMYHIAHQESDDTPAYSIVDGAERQNAIHKG